eukprot:3935681-Prymnesium_polylepis.1
MAAPPPDGGAAYAYEEPAGPALPRGVTEELLDGVSEDQILSINQDELKRRAPPVAALPRLRAPAARRLSRLNSHTTPPRPAHSPDVRRRPHHVYRRHAGRAIVCAGCAQGGSQGRGQVLEPADVVVRHVVPAL